MGAMAWLVWNGELSSLAAEQARWGDTAAVFAVVDTVEAGAPVGESVELRDLPVAMIPANAVERLGPGSVAKTRLFRDEILIAERITHADGLGPDPGSVALTLSTVATAPPIKPGDLIDIWAVDSANLSSHRIAERVTVLALVSDEVTIAVPERHVAATTAAALRPVVITLVG